MKDLFTLRIFEIIFKMGSVIYILIMLLLLVMS